MFPNFFQYIIHHIISPKDTYIFKMSISMTPSTCISRSTARLATLSKLMAGFMAVETQLIGALFLKMTQLSTKKTNFLFLNIVQIKKDLVIQQS